MITTQGATRTSTSATARSNSSRSPSPPVFPRSPFTKRYIGLDHHGHYTSACGINVYRDDLLFNGEAASAAGSSAPQTHVFICEPVHNLVQHQLLKESGATFTATRVDGEPNTDFIAGEDPWFRPVMTRTGPDGAIYVVDMYRFMIEHPDWLNPEGKAALAPFYRDGHDKGRVYRVYPKAATPRPIPRLDTLTPEQLVATLASPSGHTRDLAHRLIVQHHDPTALAPLLEKLFATSQNPLARLHALCALDGLRGPSLLTGQTLTAALKDPSPGVRAHAVRLAEPRLGTDPVLLPALAPLAADPDPLVAQQLAYSLGESDRPEAGAALAELARTWNLGGRPDQASPAPADQPHLTAAVITAATRHFKPLVALHPQTTSNLWPPLLNMAVATTDRAAIADLLGPAPQANIDAPEHRRVARFLDVLATHNTSIAKLSTTPDALTDRLKQLDAVFDSARRAAAAQPADAARSEQDVLASVALLGRQPAGRAADLALIDTLFALTVPTDVQLEAIRAAARTADPKAGDILVRHWAQMTPAVQAVAADVLMSSEPWALALVNAKPNLDFARKQRLLNHPSPKVKAAAQAALAQPPVNADRQKVIDAYAPALTLAGDSKHGQALYAEHCATCHKVGSLAGGHEMGPNLLTVREWPRENLLAAVLDPDRTVEPRYVAYTATLADGAALTGLLTTESAGSVTLKTLDDVDHPLPRASLKSLVSTNRSLMPPGFESAMTPQDLADLFAFLATPVAPR